MKIARLAVFAALCPALIVAAEPRRPTPEAVRMWQARKFGLFIHFGLYSMLGGVWNGEPVRQGYSEQIMRHAPIAHDAYAALAGRFNPESFDADAIARLAQEAGMKFIVITSKHHDGFNMFHTRLSGFNIVDASPYRRDIVKELADACRRHGLSFGVYYSTIDWHDSRATPPSAPPDEENDNRIPPAHEAFNIGQIQELMSGYGPLSEIWFDMGQPTPLQSRHFADAVHRIQPDCMVSGRVFNSQGDFTVMGDNALPDSIIDEPWQTPASMYDETWGYRSWQERNDLAGKTDEHILKLVKVVSRGGNYLLNIGPRGDGSVVPFEADVLRGMGRFVHANAEAIYDTQPQPFRELDFGYATVKPGRLYLFITKWPADGRLRLPGLRNQIVRAAPLGASGSSLKFESVSREPVIDVSTLHPVAGPTVVVAEFSGALNVVPASIGPDSSGSLVLNSKQATSYFNYNGRGYYDPPTVYKLRWDIAPAQGKYRVEIGYRANDAKRSIELTAGGRTLAIELAPARPDRSASAMAGTLEFGKVESAPLILTPKKPFAKGDRLGVVVDRVTLTPIR